MVHRALSLISVLCCVFVCASFALFANDQLAGASQHQQSELVSTSAPAPSAPKAAAATAPRRVAPKSHRTSPRKVIDEVAQKLTSPFDSLVRSNNDWVRHGVPTVLALLVYGLGLSMAARYASTIHA